MYAIGGHVNPIDCAVAVCEVTAVATIIRRKGVRRARRRKLLLSAPPARRMIVHPKMSRLRLYYERECSYRFGDLLIRLTARLRDRSKRFARSRLIFMFVFRDRLIARSRILFL